MSQTKDCHRERQHHTGTLKDGKLTRSVPGNVCVQRHQATSQALPSSPSFACRVEFYFINRTSGCSLVASAVLVVKDGGASNDSLDFALGDDVVMLDADIIMIYGE